MGPNGVTASIRGNTVVLRGPAGRRTVLKGHRDDRESASFSPDGSLVATASRDHDVRIWDVETGEEIVSPLQHNSEVRDVRVQPRRQMDRHLRGEGGALGFDVRDGSLIMRLQGHDGTADLGRVRSGRADDRHRGRRRNRPDLQCAVCGGLDDLLPLARTRLAQTGRKLTPEERERYLG